MNGLNMRISVNIWYIFEVWFKKLCYKVKKCCLLWRVDFSIVYGRFVYVFVVGWFVEVI